MKPDKARAILVVEDERIVAKYLERTLERLGYHAVGTAARGDEAIAKAETLTPDLVLMDIRLEGPMDGIEAAQTIRERFGTPVVFLTAHSDDQTLERAVATEPFGYLVKPLNETELRCAVEVAVHRHKAEIAMRERETMLRSLSLLDELTELYNRRGFLTLAQQQLKVAKRHKYSTSLLFLDLDGLKQINDGTGHAAGDQALRDTATVLRRTFRDSDILARMGGDEFAVLLIATSEQTCQRAIERLRTQIDAFNVDEDRPFRLEMSVGSATPIEEDQDDVERLLARADAAMYANKRARREGTAR